MDFQYLALTAKACVRYLKHSRIPKAEGKRIIVAGNGPSLQPIIENHLPLLQKERVLCVNHFVNTPEFSRIKPRYYCMMDPNFFLTRLSDEREKGRNLTFENLNGQTTWDMDLFFPCLPGQIDLEKYLISPHLHMHICNIFPGFTWPGIRNFVYRTGLFMPPPQNVLVAALFHAINMGYKEIYLLGADHSWIEELRVKDDNRLYLVHKHFSGETDEIPAYKSAPHNTETIKMHEMMEAYRRAFRSYWLLREYAEKRGASIFNSTPHSYIDAFDRRDISSIEENNEP